MAEREMPPRISVVLPVRNEAESILGLLQELERQEYPSSNFEVIVADGESTDSTVEIVNAFARTARMDVRVVQNAALRASGGRNAGVVAARGDIILFLDGHCHLPSPNLLRDTERVLAETGADCLCRPQPLLAPRSSATGRLIAAVRASTLGHGRDSFIYNLRHSGFIDPASSGATYLRRTLEHVGPYDERFDACEDVELNVRVRKAGLRAFTCPELAVYYEPRKTIAGLFRQMTRYGRGRIRLAGKHPDTLSVSTLLPLFFLMFVAAGVVSAWLPWPLRWGVDALLLLFLAATVVSSIRISRDVGARALWQGPAVYFAIYAGLGWGMLLELFSQLRTKRRRATAAR